MQNWDLIESFTGVSKPDKNKRSQNVFDKPLCAEQLWIGIDTLENSTLMPRLKKRYTLMLYLMYRLQMSLSEVMQLRGNDLNRHKKALAGIELPELKSFQFIFHSPHKLFIPLSRSKIMHDLMPLLAEELKIWSEAA